MFRLRPPGVAKREYDIQPIPTKYRGTFFKSRLEARWAVFFDFAQIHWQYEPQVIHIGEQLYYLPDFFLYGKKHEMFAEVKPNVFTQTEKSKCQALAEATEMYCLGLDDTPNLQKEYFLYHPNKYLSQNYQAFHLFFVCSDFYLVPDKRNPKYAETIRKANIQFSEAQHKALTHRF